MAQSVLDIILRFKSEGKGADEAKNSLGGLKGAFEDITGVSLTAGAAIGALTGALAFSVQEAIAAESVQAQLNAVLESTGGAAGLSADEINNLAEELSALSGVEDDAIVNAESVLLTFTKIGREVFPDATLAALNMSAALGQDLQSSIIQIGKALNDPIQGITALQRVGVSFTDSQREMVTAMVEAGDVIGAQKFILQELETEFGGVAEAAGDTLAGKMAHLQNTVGNLAEEIGGRLIPALSTAADAALVLVNALPAISAAFEEHEVDVRNAAGAYDEYIVEMIRAGMVAGRLPAQMAPLLDAYAKGEELSDRNRRAVEDLLVAQGILTREDFNGWQTRSLLNESFDATASAMGPAVEATEQLTEATQEAAQANLDFDAGLMDSSTASLPAYQVSLMEARMEAERLAQVGSAVVNANTNIASSIDQLIDRIEFYKAGGVEIEKTYEAIEAAIESGKITPEEGEAFLEGLRVAAANLLIELGEQTPEQAAEGLASSLGISLEEAAALIQNFTDEDLAALQAALGEAVGDPAIANNLQAFNDALSAMDLETAAADMTNLVQPATEFSTVVSETLSPALSTVNDSMSSFTGELKTFADTITVGLLDGLKDLANTLVTDVNPDIEAMYSLIYQEFNPALDESIGLLSDYIGGLEDTAGAFTGLEEAAEGGVGVIEDLASNLGDAGTAASTAAGKVQTLIDKINAIPEGADVYIDVDNSDALRELQEVIDKINKIPDTVYISIEADDNSGGGGGGACFVPGTPVLMDNGETWPIEDIQPGDVVRSYDPQTGQFHPGTVKATINRYGPARLGIKLSNGTVVTTTPAHPFYFPGATYGQHKDFIAARDLRTGDRLHCSDGAAVGHAAIVEIVHLPGGPVHNLTIEPNHTYLAAGIIVHNDKPPESMAAVMSGAAGGGIGSVIIQNVNLSGGAGDTPQMLLDRFKTALELEIAQARQAGMGTRGDA